MTRSGTVLRGNFCFCAFVEVYPAIIALLMAPPARRIWRDKIGRGAAPCVIRDMRACVCVCVEKPCPCVARRSEVVSLVDSGKGMEEVELKLCENELRLEWITLSSWALWCVGRRFDRLANEIIPGEGGHGKKMQPLVVVVVPQRATRFFFKQYLVLAAQQVHHFYETLSYKHVPRTTLQLKRRRQIRHLERRTKR